MEVGVYKESAASLSGTRYPTLEPFKTTPGALRYLTTPSEYSKGANPATPRMALDIVSRLRIGASSHESSTMRPSFARLAGSSATFPLFFQERSPVELPEK